MKWLITLRSSAALFSGTLFKIFVALYWEALTFTS